MTQKREFFTTPIYYVNDVPHIGHAYTSIAVDFLARFSRLNGNEVRFLTGTDEHGLKIQKAAELASISPIDLCNKNSIIFRDLTKKLNLSNDDFIRTTETRHKNGASYLWKLLFENGDIYLDEYTGWYSINDETFYNEKDLIKQNDGSFKTITGGPVEWIKEESYFFRLSKYQEKLLDYYNKYPDFILPESKRNEVINFVKGGLKDLSVSRTSFNWGISVPNDSNHIMYVWLDALTSYPNSISYLDTNQNEMSSFWSNVTHVVGKDILRHHAIYWPAFLIAAKLELPKRIYAHGWWTNEGNKISKSLGNVIDPVSIIDEYGLDQFRYFLFREVPFGNDGDFSKDAIAQRVNADLSNNYGNLIQRIASFIIKNANAEVSKPNEIKEKDNKLLQEFNVTFKNYLDNMEIFQIDKALKNIFEYLSEVNAYVDEQAPWALKKTDTTRMQDVLYVITLITIKCSVLLQPVIPSSIDKILKIYNLSLKDLNLVNIKDFNPNKIILNKPNPIFPRIEQ